MDDDVYKFEDCPIIKVSRLQATVIIYKLDILFKDAALGLLVHRPTHRSLLCIHAAATLGLPVHRLKSPISNHTHSNIWIITEVR